MAAPATPLVTIAFGKPPHSAESGVAENDVKFGLSGYWGAPNRALTAGLRSRRYAARAQLDHQFKPERCGDAAERGNTWGAASCF